MIHDISYLLWMSSHLVLEPMYLSLLLFFLILIVMTCGFILMASTLSESPIIITTFGGSSTTTNIFPISRDTEWQQINRRTCSYMMGLTDTSLRSHIIDFRTVRDLALSCPHFVQSNGTREYQFLCVIQNVECQTG